MITYDVRRSLAGQDDWTIIVTDLTQTQYLDMGLDPETGYDYQVRACDGAECSDWSPTANATTLETPAVTYDVRRSLAGQDDWTIIATNLGVTQYLDTGLEPNTAYDYQVRACTENGCSNWSPTVSATTHSAGTVIGNIGTFPFEGLGDVFSSTLVGGIGTFPFEGLGHPVDVVMRVGGVGTFPFSGLGNLQNNRFIGGIGTFPFEGLGNVGELINLVGGIGTFPFEGLSEIEVLFVVAARLDIPLIVRTDFVPTIIEARLPLLLIVRDNYTGRGTGIITIIDRPLVEQLNEGDTFQFDDPFAGLMGQSGLARLMQYTESDTEYSGEYDLIPFTDSAFAQLLDELGRPRHTVKLSGSVLRQIRELQRGRR